MAPGVYLRGIQGGFSFLPVSIFQIVRLLYDVYKGNRILKIHFSRYPLQINHFQQSQILYEPDY